MANAIRMILLCSLHGTTPPPSHQRCAMCGAPFQLWMGNYPEDWRQLCALHALERELRWGPPEPDRW